MEFTFDDFKKRAKNHSLSKWEKIGFPDSYRKDKEDLIFEDINSKLILDSKGLNILDIGCGCSDLVSRLINCSVKNKSYLYLVDSEEMLNNINKQSLNNNIHLIPGYFPKVKFPHKGSYKSFDRILVYSVIQYVFLEQSIFDFIHQCINLLNPSGRLLIGDIPNISARERFINSDKGEEFVKNGSNKNLTIQLKHEKQERIDDSIVLAILSRFRNFECETYLLPQNQNLPFGNRREDILIIKR